MQGDWGRWMSDHAEMITVTEGAGKTKVVTSALTPASGEWSHPLYGS
jgi:hypothetical protein